MKLAVIARVNGGLDIIEPFVRHHVQHFDKLIILNNGTSDDTYQVLHQLQRVYSDLVVLRQPTIGYRQHQYMLLLLRMAVDKFGADWVAFIDADEFIETADGSGADAGSGWAAADSLQAGMEQLRLRFGPGER